MAVFRWPVTWRTRSIDIDDGEGLAVRMSSDQVIFHGVESFYDTVPDDLLYYVSREFYCCPKKIGRLFSHPWQPIEAMRQPDKRALKEWFTPMRDSLLAKIPPPRRRRRVGAWRDDGNEVSIDRLRGGHTSFFRTTRSQLRDGGQSVALLVDLAIQHDVAGANLYWRGAAVAALADRLEAAGYIVEVWALCRGGLYGKFRKKNADPTAMIAIELKAGGEHLDIASVVNVLSWMPRVIFYPLVATAPCLRKMVEAGQSPTTRSWFWFDVWSLESLNLPADSFLLYGFDSEVASIQAMMAVINDLDQKKGFDR